MRKTALILLAFMGAVSAWAQGTDDSSQKQPTPVENLWFATDELIYIPKYIFYFGPRALSGAKATFGGTGTIASYSVNSFVTNAINVTRTYQDGLVGADSRRDGAGNLIASADGMTNYWSYKSSAQETVPGYIAMHTYSAQVTDTLERSKAMGNILGMEGSISYDMGKLYNRVTWNLSAGMGLNDIKAASKSAVSANLTTLTDLYTLRGAPAPGVDGAGYTAPSSSTVTVVGPNGSTLYVDPPTNSTAQTVTIDTTTLLGAQPSNRSQAVTGTTDAVTNAWKVKGAFITLRAGPSIGIPITDSFRATISVGAALAYVGTTYTVDQELTPTTGDVISDSVSGFQSKLRPGFYIDANIEYWLSERAGFYAGGAYQNNGTYEQKITTTVANYATRVDLSKLTGIRTGVNIKF
jgi:hypothetical protein